MSTQTLYTGVALIVLGIGGYVASGAASVTALIPAFIGSVFVVLGLLGRKESRRKHVMHAAMLLALLAIGGTFRGITGMLGWLGDASDLDLTARFFELRLLCLLGYRPQLFQCVGCRRQIEPCTIC